MNSVLLEIDGAIATLTLNRPEALNALDRAMSLDLSALTSRLEDDDSVRCVVLQGAGEHFMAGGDIKFFHQGLDEPQDVRKLQMEHLIGEVQE